MQKIFVFLLLILIVSSKVLRKKKKTHNKQERVDLSIKETLKYAVAGAAGVAAYVLVRGPIKETANFAKNQVIK